MTAFAVNRNSLQEDSVHSFSVCASDIGLRPGQWPGMIEVNGGIGNGLRFLIAETQVDHGDVRYVKYRQNMGCLVLRVYND